MSGVSLIKRFAIAGYRSFGADLQKIGPLAQINLFIGQNNSGKSNVLLFLHDHYASVINPIQTKKKGLSLSTIGRHQGAAPTEVQFGIKVAPEVVQETADIAVLDLKRMIERIVAFISEANDIQ